MAHLFDEDEVDWLIENCRALTADKLAAELGRSRKGVTVKLALLGLRARPGAVPRYCHDGEAAAKIRAARIPLYAELAAKGLPLVLRYDQLRETA